MNKEEISYIDEYNNFWKYIVENEDGTLNKDQVMRELSDYSMVLDNCAKAYCTMTNQRISKQNTKFFEVENIFNQEFIEQRYYDELQERIDKAIEYIEENLSEDDNGCGCWWQSFEYYTDAKSKLLGILKGENNENN